jgi:3D (Asp-Asp-Asp) domain-containing protein
MQYQIASFTAPIVRGVASGALAIALSGCAFGHEREAESMFETAIVRALEANESNEAENDETRPDEPDNADSLESKQQPEVANDNVEPAKEAETETATVVPLGKAKGTYQLTYYWMAAEGYSKEPRDTTIYTSTCKPLAKITAEYAKRLLIEGTGRLRNGWTVNVSGNCDCPLSPCFFIVPKSKRWGVGVRYRPLRPFRSVAVDPAMVSIGQTLYIPELDGLTMPGKAPWGGFVHDGCVMADDRGGGIKDEQLDFFMGQFNFYDGFFKRHRIQSVTVYDGKTRCKNEDGKLVPVNRNSI